jgi:ubiquinone/menaquinone biosynthesis C-methylase UbiE
MMNDPRKGNAEYYDLDVTPLPDISFYLTLVRPDTSVLELGCGTGRVLIPLAARCKSITGVDYSEAMIDRCRFKMKTAGVKNATAQVADITKLNLEKRFDLIIAPYRVMQALATDTEVTGLFDSVQRHLEKGGAAILNTFKMRRPREEMLRTWVNLNEQVRWEKHMPDGTRVVHSEIYRSIDPEKMVLYPELVYRRFQGERLLDEFVQKIKMRCYEADELVDVIKRHGFKIQNKWGGYRNEVYGEGPEQVISFGAG